MIELDPSTNPTLSVRIELDPSKNPTMSVDDIAVTFGIARSTAFAAVKAGEIPSIRFGKRIRVPTAAVRRMLELDDIEDEPRGFDRPANESALAAGPSKPRQAATAAQGGVPDAVD